MIISHYFLQIFTIYYFHFHDVMIQLIHFHLYFPVHCVKTYEQQKLNYI